MQKHTYPIMLATVLFLSCTAANAVSAAELAGNSTPVILGLSAIGADQHNAEFQVYDRMLPVYRENGIRAALLEASLFYQHDCSEEKLLEMLKRFHVVHLATTEEGVDQFDQTHKKRRGHCGTRTGAICRGRGRTVSPAATGPLSKHRHRVVLERRARAAGRKILHEGVFDKTRSFEGMTLVKATFFHTAQH